MGFFKLMGFLKHEHVEQNEHSIIMYPALLVFTCVSF